MCLYEYFFDPEVDLDGVNFIPDEEEEQITEEILTYRSAEELDFKNLNDKQALGHAIKDMYYSNKKWDLLYKDGRLRSDVFDPDSYHEMLQYRGFEDFEYVFRIIPDIFTKAYKSIEIAKLWWTMANKVYDVLPGTFGRKNYSTRQLKKRTNELEEKIAKLANDIESEEKLVKVKLIDLEGLREREIRCDKLKGNCEEMEVARDTAHRRYVDVIIIVK